ncbi:hypothetical protein BKA62DRAFT_699195, partial [Auriculariales sp. MPI-PUGE-AT-0066]
MTLIAKKKPYLVIALSFRSLFSSSSSGTLKQERGGRDCRYYTQQVYRKRTNDENGGGGEGKERAKTSERDWA